MIKLFVESISLIFALNFDSILLFKGPKKDCNCDQECALIQSQKSLVFPRDLFLQNLEYHHQSLPLLHMKSLHRFYRFQQMISP